MIDKDKKIEKLEERIETLKILVSTCNHKFERTISTSIIQCNKCGKSLLWGFGLGWV